MSQMKNYREGESHNSGQSTHIKNSNLNMLERIVSAEILKIDTHKAVAVLIVKLELICNIYTAQTNAIFIQI